jgi:diguanylate cyclase (GGDEF)-like protein/PAS domain S-box-containing protein
MKTSSIDIFSYLLLLGLGAALFALNPLQLDTARHQAVVEDINRLQKLDSDIDRDVLRIGYSILQHYDSIATSIRDIRILKSSLLDQEADSIAGITPLLQQLNQELEHKIKAAEKVVSNFALLNNSMFYFPTLVTQYTIQYKDKWNPVIQKLAMDIMQFRNNPSASNKLAITYILNQLEQPSPSGSNSQLLKAIYTHAKIIVTARDEVSRHIQNMFRTPTEQALSRVSTRYNTHHGHSMDSARQLRYLLNMIIFFLLIGIAWFISRIKSSKAVMRESQERMEHALEGTNNGLWDWDIQHSDLYLSPRFEVTLGYAAGEINTRVNSLKALIHPDDIGMVRQKLAEHLRGKSSIFESEHRTRTKDGSWIWTQVCGKVVERDDNQKALRMVGTQTDITERKMVEEQLQQGAMVFETVSEAVAICNRENRIIAVNQAFTDITGYGDEVIGKDPKILSSGKHDQAFHAAMWSELMETGVWQGEIWNRRKNGEIYPEWLSIATIKNNTGEIDQFISVFSDITQRKENEELIRFQANYDALTELPNRHLLMERLSFELQRAKRENTMVALMFIDLDRFKPVNDTYGHMVGDQLLWEVSKRLTNHVRETDMVARLGGDEFTVVLPDIDNLNEVEHMARRILHEIAQPFHLGGHELFISTSVGITIYPNDAADLPTLMTNADNAMYRAKDNGRNTFCFFTNEMNHHAREMLRLENDLHRAIQRNELIPYFQPITDIDSGELIGAETLLRWNHPEYGMMGPDSFISIAETTGLIIPIGKWLLELVCCQMMRWRSNGLHLKRICVNISSRQFRYDLLGVVQNALETSGLEPEYLELEIVESLLLEENQENSDTLKRLNDMGVRLSIDDFGTGYSSLGYLKRFPFDVLKINHSFIKGLPDSRDNTTLVNTIINMAHGLGLEVVAEGVESARQLEHLHSMDCHLAQGYYFSKPLPANQFEKRMQKPFNTGLTEEQL